VTQVLTLISANNDFVIYTLDPYLFYPRQGASITISDKYIWSLDHICLLIWSRFPDMVLYIFQIWSDLCQIWSDFSDMVMSLLDMVDVFFIWSSFSDMVHIGFIWSCYVLDMVIFHQIWSCKYIYFPGTVNITYYG